jgi:hypothetical protein
MISFLFSFFVTDAVTKKTRALDAQTELPLVYISNRTGRYFFGNFISPLDSSLKFCTRSIYFFDGYSGNIETLEGEGSEEEYFSCKETGYRNFSMPNRKNLVRAGNTIIYEGNQYDFNQSGVFTRINNFNLTWEDKTLVKINNIQVQYTKNGFITNALDLLNVEYDKNNITKINTNKYTYNSQNQLILVNNKPPELLEPEFELKNNRDLHYRGNKEEFLSNQYKNSKGKRVHGCSSPSRCILFGKAYTIIESPQEVSIMRDKQTIVVYFSGDTIQEIIVNNKRLVASVDFLNPDTIEFINTAHLFKAYMYFRYNKGRDQVIND